jgi:hypothetical protein
MTPMRRSILVSLSTLALGASLALFACKRQEAAPPPPAAPPAVQAPAPTAAPAPAPFRVTGVTVGNAVGADKRVTTPSSVLAVTDTIYASVATDGTDEAVKLTARWLYEGDTLVKEESIDIASAGPEVTAFQVSKPDGWPTGKYKVEIHKDGVPTATQEFEVR